LNFYYEPFIKAKSPPEMISEGFAISMKKVHPVEYINQNYLSISFKNLTNYLLSVFFVLIHSGNRVITTPIDIPNAIINQKPALLGLHSILE
jgi:hypothetical protein